MGKQVFRCSACHGPVVANYGDVCASCLKKAADHVAKLAAEKAARIAAAKQRAAEQKKKK